jgi:hypothetical protein
MTLSLAVSVEVAGGALVVHSKSMSLEAVLWFGLVFPVFLAAASLEELLVRGFLFQAIEHNLGPAAAVAITSVVFGVMHLGNENVTIFSTANTVLAGVWLGVAYLKTRSLWLAIGLHYSWNLTMGFVFGLPVSGEDLFQRLSLLASESGSRDWLSGGGYGPEGGAATTIAIAISTIVVLKSGLFRPSSEMLEAIRHGTLKAREILRVTP